VRSATYYVKSPKLTLRAFYISWHSHFYMDSYLPLLSVLPIIFSFPITDRTLQVCDKILITEESSFLIGYLVH
ncbi:hypothetical protein, partial [Pectobacterium sp. CFBP8739]|uniref:hypothetical protein n=1 Tax=Pectobacterium sp. CFBP8739 TaxID=2748908 RepID=UPI001C5D39E2